MARRSRRCKPSKRLVIDACVAGACGGKDAVHPTSKYCRDFLLEVLELCHHVVWTPAIADEWKEHRSAYARKWLVFMYGRKKVDGIGDCADVLLRDRVGKGIRSPKKRELALDDIHLIEAALVTDRIVVSRDETVRNILSSASDKVRTLCEIAWVDPCREEESPIQWLRSGAKPEEGHRLGSH